MTIPIPQPFYLFTLSITLFLTPDENECNPPSDDYNYDTETPHICGKNAACINTNGSFYCQCAPGFRSSSQWMNFTADSPEKCLGKC